MAAIGGTKVMMKYFGGSLLFTIFCHGLGGLVGYTMMGGTLGAVLSTIHDLLMVIGMFVMFGRQFNASMVAGNFSGASWPGMYSRSKGLPFSAATSGSAPKWNVTLANWSKPL